MIGFERLKSSPATLKPRLEVEKNISALIRLGHTKTKSVYFVFILNLTLPSLYGLKAGANNSG